MSVAGCSCVAPFISTERLFSILSVNVWEQAIASDVLENNYTCALMHCHSGRLDNISGIRDVSATGIFREIRGTRPTFLCKSREVFGYFDTTPESPPRHTHTQPSKICSMRQSTQRTGRQMLCWKNPLLEMSWENHHYRSFLGLKTSLITRLALLKYIKSHLQPKCGLCLLFYQKAYSLMDLVNANVSNRWLHHDVV